MCRKRHAVPLLRRCSARRWIDRCHTRLGKSHYKLEGSRLGNGKDGAKKSAAIPFLQESPRTLSRPGTVQTTWRMS